MFERNKVDSLSQQQHMTVPVEIELDDGDTLRGKFIIPASRSLFDVLNSAGAFIEFEPYGGERSILAKTAVKAVRLVNAPAPTNLAARAREIDGFDPYTVLGVTRDTSFEEVRQSYLRLSKTYHPDRYSSVELPLEVGDYLAAMARRINTAYAQLEAPAQIKKVAAQRAAPIYTSGPRA